MDRFYPLISKGERERERERSARVARLMKNAEGIRRGSDESAWARETFFFPLAPQHHVGVYKKGARLVNIGRGGSRGITTLAAKRFRV